MFKKEKSLNSKMSDETLSVNLFVICDYALVSQEGKLSINGIFDNIYTEQTPSIHPQAFIVLSLKGKPLSEHDIKLEISSPNGKTIVINVPVRIGPNGAHNIVSRLSPLPLDEFGEYLVSVKEKQRNFGKLRFSVIKTKGQGEKTVN
ncbi:hypothetical protein A3I53_02215 [Candidatus Curtissbacteria bacterium RIFCSPLOWO2_02_FULL_40_13b]|uniref:Wzt C-terminal domain-containing protein n=3 Tax=Candidatus Curtissiibacteriota TaxID=1752717 RepID=A0A1F5HUX1_9BACT|nr:MAG: hypothetical protein A2693_00255 [Candidatus Curtissbacteria bacterium RIFCSPHIGHO2_01_FULL_40_12]OGE07789.1 MAG: hypothetical protein A3I53_02215 [Candidatus Curtissbacteria bacterium RIFCSPLOWO2_02_FULL_40_13b]